MFDITHRSLQNYLRILFYIAQLDTRRMYHNLAQNQNFVYMILEYLLTNI